MNPARRASRQRITLEIPLTSLMSPTAAAAPRSSGSAPWEADLGLADLVAALAPNGRYTAYVRQTLTALTTDPATIGWRQAVLADFLANPPLVEQATALLPRLAALQQGNALLGKRQRPLLLEVADHLAELDSFVQVAETLHAALTSARLDSPALTRLCADLAALTANPDFQSLRHDLPGLRAPLERIRSLTIGINLDLELRPISTLLLAINDHKLAEPQSWLSRAIGGSRDDQDETGIAPLHPMPEDPTQRPLYPLYQDLDKLLTQVAQPVSKALTRYARGGSASFAHLEFELAFFTSAARLAVSLRSRGLPICQPEIAPPDDRLIQIDGLLNPALAIRPAEQPVPSAVDFGPDGRIAVLTGPNSGGKTTYLRAVGLSLVMAQAGLFITAARARLSPVDAILTHFPALETRQQGRLAEEALRLRDIFQRATRRSLVLLNETFSSTASGEAVYLAYDILGALRALGLRAIFATHLVELADHLPDIEAAVESDSRLFSLVAGVHLDESGQAIPTYRVERGLPLGRSYARDIAQRHGITLDQLLASRPPPP
jgi:hypothetical protein